MKIYKHGFIGHDDATSTAFWSGGDGPENFRKTLKENPNWYYKDRPITYKFNSLGHRSKEISELDLDNYILFTGCSHTEGVGLELETTYSYLIADQLKCDYYNLGLGATGIDVVVHNLIIWFATIPKKPKFVVIQWPDQTRTITGTTSDTLATRGMWEKNLPYDKFVSYGMDVDFFECRKLLAHTIVKNIIQVPTIYFGIEKVIPFDQDTLIGRVVDNARDNGHPGVQSNKNFAAMIIDSL